MGKAWFSGPTTPAEKAADTRETTAVERELADAEAADPDGDWDDPNQ